MVYRNASDSEMSDVEDAKVTLSQDYTGPAGATTSQSIVRLVELGPRLSLTLLKVEEGFFTGAVLYHKFGTLFYSCVC